MVNVDSDKCTALKGGRSNCVNIPLVGGIWRKDRSGVDHTPVCERPAHPRTRGISLCLVGWATNCVAAVLKLRRKPASRRATGCGHRVGASYSVLSVRRIVAMMPSGNPVSRFRANAQNQSSSVRAFEFEKLAAWSGCQIGVPIGSRIATD